MSRRCSGNMFNNGSLKLADTVGGATGHVATASMWNDVKSAVASLSVNKACGMDFLSAEHLLYASPEIHTLLAICFNAFIVHSFYLVILHTLLVYLLSKTNVKTFLT